MNEKIRKYLRLKNDKRLISENIPNENDLENFEKWKKRMRRKDLKLIIFSSTILIFVYVILLSTGIFSLAELKEKIFGIICMFIFIYFEYILIKKYIKSKKWKMEYCNYANVIDKYKIPTGKYKEYYIVVNINGNKLKIKTNEYSLIDIGDEVIVFLIEGNNELYITKK